MSVLNGIAYYQCRRDEAPNQELAGTLAATNEARRTTLLPSLFELLRTCRPSDVPRHAERILIAVTTENKDGFIAVLQERMTLMTAAQAARLNKDPTGGDALNTSGFAASKVEETPSGM